MTDRSLNRTVLAGLILEGVAIVASILLAFGIDAWWGEFQDAVDTRDTVRDVRGEFQDHRAALEGRLADWNRRTGSMERLLEASSQGRAVGVPVMDTLLHDLLWTSTFDPPSGAREALIASGRLDFIRSEELKSALIEWPAVADEVRDNEILAREFVTLVLQPYLARQGVPLGRVLGLGRSWPGGADPPDRAAERYRAILADDEFRAHVAYRYSLVNPREYETAVDFVERLLDAVTQELGEG